MAFAAVAYKRDYFPNIHGKNLSLKKSSTLCNTRGQVRKSTKYYEPPY